MFPADENGRIAGARISIEGVKTRIVPTDPSSRLYPGYYPGWSTAIIPIKSLTLCVTYPKIIPIDIPV